MTFFTDWFRRVDGNALTRNADHTAIVAATQYGVPLIGGPLGDGNASSGFLFSPSSVVGIPGVNNFIVPALTLGSAPGDDVPNDEPIPDGLAGHTWGVTLSTSVDQDTYAFPPELVDAGYTLRLGFATADFGGIASSVSASFDLVTGSPYLALSQLINDGTMGLPLPFATVDQTMVDSVNAGIHQPYMQVDGPDTDLDPLFYLADMVLSIDTEVGGLIRRACRQYPRDDVLGIGSANRIHPPPRGRRVAGGFA